VSRLSRVAQGQRAARDRRLVRGPTAISCLRAELARQDSRRRAARGDQHGCARAGALPSRERAQPRSVVRGIRRPARREGVPRARRARPDLVTGSTLDRCPWRRGDRSRSRAYFGRYAVRAVSPYGTGPTVARILICLCRSTVGFDVPPPSSPQSSVTFVPGFACFSSITASDSIERSLKLYPVYVDRPI